MKIIKTLIFLFFISNLAYADNEISKISVTGKSKITLEAQYSIIHTDIKCVHKEMDKSYEKLEQLISKVLENLKKIGLSDNEITKSVVRQGAEYTWQNNSRERIGYYSSNNIQLRVNDLKQLRSIYQELSKYNSLTIQDTDDGRNDEFEKRNVEFKKALLIAKEKAELMAKCLGAKIGSVFNIKEISTQNIFKENSYENRVSSERIGGTFGSVDIIATVSVDFTLK